MRIFVDIPINWEAYATLQMYLEGWNHTQNEVICGQNECHSDLCLEEFKAFGSIRAGHRIQLRNLYRALASNILSLAEEPVLALLIQTVWQVGPRKEGKWEAHEDFADNDGFSLEFLTLLENIVKTNENNYAHPCILIGAVAITTRIMELNRATLNKGKKLLKEWRALMTTWRGKVMKSCKKEDSKMDLERNLLLINVCFALSYNLSKDIVWEMFRNGEGDLVGWLHTVNYFYEMKDYKGSLSPFMKLLHDLGRDVALKLKLEEKDLSSSFYFKWVKIFVAEKWSKAGECHEPEIVKVENKNILGLRYKSKAKEVESLNIVTFDLILGTFFVNGYPPGQLPKEVTQNKTFLNFFGESSKKLVVQQESDCVFRTIGEFRGSHYEFSLLKGANTSSELLVKQIQKDKEMILLEPSTLKGALQGNFITDYYHWFHPDSGIIDFKRKINLGSENDRVEYRLIKNEEENQVNLSTWRFYDEANKAYLLSVNSKGFQNLAAFLSSFERKEFINVLVDKEDPEEVTVLLLRYNLKFKVDLLRCLLQSVEYPGYAVTGPVDVATLVGLQQGIQLQKGEKKILLIPNGDIHLDQADYHHNTVISLDKLGSPAYFKFECDDVLRRFVGKSKVAYLYLAALHAVTSLTSGQPDPFTGLTGTEMAVRILQSGFIWSSIPYDEDCLKVLKFIEGLSPKRRNYGEGEGEIKSGDEIIEVIEWPKILPSLSAFDGFELIVRKLISDSEKLQVLHGKEKNEDVKQEPSSLRIRAYFKYLNYYNSAAKLDLGQLDLPPPTLKKSILKTKSRYFLSQLQTISNVRHLSSPQSLELFQPDSLIPFLHAGTPKPILWKVPSWHSSLILLFKNIGLREDWFWLYKMASKKEKTPEEVQTFTLILSVLAYRGFGIQQVINLHYLSVFTSHLELPKVPECFPLIQQSYVLTTDPSQTEIDKYFGKTLRQKWTSKSSNPYASIKVEKYSKCLSEMRKYWSACPKCGPGFSDATYSIRSHTGLTTLHIKDVLNAAADQVNIWHCQKNFREFVQTVQDQLNRAHKLSQDDPIPTLEGDSEVKVILKPDLEKYGSGRDFNIEVRKLLDITAPDEYFLWTRIIYDKEESLGEFDVGVCHLFNLAKRSKLMEKADDIMEVFQSEEFGGKILQCTSIYPRTDPVTLLRIFVQLKHCKDEESNQLCTLIGALAMIWAQLKRLSRCKILSFTKQHTELKRELENIPHENWNPSEYPEWLCLELELDITIRSRQVEVAKRMLSMPGGNGVMQLNMGEGKTSVIVPMLCSVLGVEDNFCRVTILASMFNTNYKILSFAIGGILNKRVYVVIWRVEYGVDYEKTQRLMAVPFRAKDFPVERTEFGHPDLAILLTHLNYYYSGLSNKEMDEVLKLLRSKSEADSIYRLWIEQVPDKLIPGHLKSFRGINFKDSEQLEILYKLLRRHTFVINFWLSKKVFPRECKQFPSKLVMSSWDLCNEMNAFPTTGFSGTNDSSVLLPLQITQQDLPSLLDTNEKMMKTLIKPENKGHRYFKAGVTCKAILVQMTKDGVKVLMDAGALMLDKNNEEVARLWLKINPELEGVLFFNKKNDLTVKSRGNGGEEVDIPLELSPYHGRLEKVGVFLDDQHTRGTDLKFPNDWRAVVAVGAGMKRDKLTQACMRMRKLDQGQSVSFYLSQEVFDKIKGSSNTVDISSKEVLKFVEENTRKFNEDGLVHWAIGGRNYAQRLLAEELFLNSVMDLEDKEEMGKYAELLARRCVDEEITSLEGMYGKNSTLDRLANVIPNWFEAVLKKIPEDDQDFEEFYRNFKRIRDEIVARCESHAPNKLYFSSGENMEEEQEKELEMEEEKETEMEEEVVMEKPEKLMPALHNLHPNVSNFVVKGEPLKVQDGIVKLCEIFKGTNFADILQPDAWDGDVFATQDFITVTKKEEDYFTDEYLRPVEYFAAVATPTTQVLLLSPFEVNEMMSLFKNVDIPTTLHMFSIRRSEKQRLLLDNQGLTLPMGSVPTPLKEMSRSALLLASGNLYFGSEKEQKAFTEFLCLAPKPWTEEEERGCEAKQITKTGFMVPGYVKRRDYRGGSKGFSDDPSELVRRILECRHSVLNEISHVVRLLNEKKLIDFK